MDKCKLDKLYKILVTKNKDIYKRLAGCNDDIKLNNLLYFAQLISLVKYNKPLFEEDMYAYSNGIIIKTQNDNNIRLMNNEEYKLDTLIEDVLNITKDVFMESPSEELSEIIQSHTCWRDCINKEDKKIDIKNFKNKYKSDIELIQQMLDAIEICDKHDFIKVNGIKFYYGDDIEITPELMNMLRDFPSDEKAYTMYMDSSQGLVIY